MNFTLKHYKKGASIQLKPKKDISLDPARCVHFSIAWFKNDAKEGDDDEEEKDAEKNVFSKEQQRQITAELYKELTAYLKSVNWKLNFTVVKACENCSYGHFDAEFENIVLAARSKHALCCEKNLPLHLHPDVPQDRPILFHIAHSRSSDESFNALLKSSGKVLSINVDAAEVNK